jgi:hypothetical protein
MGAPRTQHSNHKSTSSAKQPKKQFRSAYVLMIYHNRRMMAICSGLARNSEDEAMKTYCISVGGLSRGLARGSELGMRGTI